MNPGCLYRLLTLCLLVLGLGLGATQPQAAWAKKPRLSQPAVAAPAAVQTAPLLDVIDVAVDEQGQVSLLAQQAIQATSARNFSIIKLPVPFRMVVDIPDARLSLPKSPQFQVVAPSQPGQSATYRVSVNRNGIRDIELSESASRFYQAVKLVVYVEDAKTLWQLTGKMQDKTLLVSQGPLPVDVALNNLGKSASPVARAVTDAARPDGRVVIEDIRFEDAHLMVRAAKHQNLYVKNRFTLQTPNRLVLDIGNAVVASKDLLKVINPASQESSIRQIRIGQFDEQTVRIVVETDQPERVQAVYPDVDRSKLTVGLTTDASIATLPLNTSLGQLQNVVVGKRQGDTVIRLSANAEIVHRMTRSGNQVVLELLNVAAKPEALNYANEAFPEFQHVKTESLAAGQPNSKLVVNLADPKLEVSVDVSSDRKTLDLVFLPQARMISLTGSGPATKAPYAARIVIDAGHGGKDIGANRDGVYEKDLNLQVLLLLKKELEKRGLQVYTTRSTDVFLPLPQITAITNDIKPDLFVSVHQNASTNSALNGIETYYYTPQSLALAQQVHRKMVNAVSSPDRGVRRAMFYVIHHTPVPAILCEVGYLSNAQERRELQSLERQQKTAAAIAEGVVEYLKTKATAQASPRR